MTPYSILVAEDEEHLRTLAKMFLEGAGYSVKLTKNGHEARAALAQEPFDILVTDLVMAGCGGLELITGLRKTYPALRILAMSGGGFVPVEQYLQIAKNAGAHVTLMKPFTRDTLLNAVKKLKP